MTELADRLHAWSENAPDPDYFFGGEGDVFSSMQADCRDAATALRKDCLPAEEIADEVTHCAIAIVEALLAAGALKGANPESICDLIEPHVAATVATVMVPVQTAT